MNAEVICGDCLPVMREMPDASVDAVVTDPPYGLKFMGKGWDHGVPGVPFWTEALRLAKPGAYLLAFGGTRTSHRLTCAIEDAGWQIQDSLCWLFGSGFPKHKSKLKPAHESITMAWKPAAKATVLNIDACRLASEERPLIIKTPKNGAYSGVFAQGSTAGGVTTAGRWPANVVCDEDAAAMVDAQSGACGGGRETAPDTRPSAARNGYGPGDEDGWRGAWHKSGAHFGDTGGASRFMYVAKASRAEREAGLEGAARKAGGSNAKGFTDDVARGLDRNRPVANNHPTVKPVSLMRWLVRLITPPNGIVLDPFCGSGTTGIACVHESQRFVGIEREAEYVEIARARIAHHAQQTVLEIPA